MSTRLHKLGYMFPPFFCTGTSKSMAFNNPSLWSSSLGKCYKMKSTVILGTLIAYNQKQKQRRDRKEGWTKIENNFWLSLELCCRHPWVHRNYYMDGYKIQSKRGRVLFMRIGAHVTKQVRIYQVTWYQSIDDNQYNTRNINKIQLQLM